MKIFAIDPGNVKSAYCIIDLKTLEPQDFGILENEELLGKIRRTGYTTTDTAAIEMIQNLGMGAVGQTVFDTAFWAGRFHEALRGQIGKEPGRVYRMQEKRHICHDTRAKDKNIRQALVDRFAQHSTTGKGTKDNPDWFYGFADDVWSAYAVAITYAEGANV